MWGFSDAVSWRAAEQPCIFDGNYRPKPAYYALRDGLPGRRPRAATGPGEGAFMSRFARGAGRLA